MKEWGDIMSNIMDYIAWRGDLDFEKAPFCEIDNLILATLSYVRLEGIPSVGFGQHQPLFKVAEQFFAMHAQEELLNDRSFAWQAPFLMQEMASAERFKEMQIGNYVNIIDEEMEVQFSIVEFILGDGTSYVAFRGTDDTLIGWKEDFYLTNGPVHAGEAAITYLNQIGMSSQRKLRIGGHSKGGYLAFYAAVGCLPKIQKRILEIYSNDGPGYTKEFIQKAKLSGQIPKFYRYIPEGSVVGLLFEYPVEPIIVKSSQKGLMQHNAFSWQLLGTKFEYAPEVHKKSLRFQAIFHEWLEGIRPEQREMVIDDFFSVLFATGATTLSELYDGGFKNLRIMAKQMEYLDPETKEIVNELIKNLMFGRTRNETKKNEVMIIEKDEEKADM